MLGAEGPKNAALAAEICDGWLPLFYFPKLAGDVQRVARRGFSPARVHGSREDFRFCATAQIIVTDDRATSLAGSNLFCSVHGRWGRGDQLHR